MPLLVLVSALVAGCGSGATNTSGSAAAEVAGIVPASAPVLIGLETDQNSDQWQQADELLSKFPGKARLLAEVRDGLADEGVDLDDELLPALGDETYLVVLDLEDGGDTGVAPDEAARPGEADGAPAGGRRRHGDARDRRLDGDLRERGDPGPVRRSRRRSSRTRTGSARRRSGSRRTRS